MPPSTTSAKSSRRARRLTGGAASTLIEVDAAVTCPLIWPLRRRRRIYGSGAGEFAVPFFSHRQEHHAALLHRLQPVQAIASAR
jgi:hypothetical protein